MSDEAKPYTLNGFIADRAHGDVDMDMARATVEALEASREANSVLARQVMDAQRERDEAREWALKDASKSADLVVGRLVAAAREEQREACAEHISRKWLGPRAEADAVASVRATPLDATPLADEIERLKAENKALRHDADKEWGASATERERLSDALRKCVEALEGCAVATFPYDDKGNEAHRKVAATLDAARGLL